MMERVFKMVPYDAYECDTEPYHFCLTYMCNEDKKSASRWCGPGDVLTDLICLWLDKNKDCKKMVFLLCGFGNVSHSLSGCH